MLSKRSSSNGPLFSATLFKKNLTRYWPLWGGVSLLGSIAPLFLLLMLMTTDPRYINAGEFTEIFYGALCYVIPALTLCYAILCAMVVWNYLYNARSVGLMHTLPLDRRCLYITGSLSGLAMMLLPYVIVGGLIILELLAFGALPVTAALQTIVGVIAMAVFYFGTATLCAMVTGHVFALPVFYFIAHFFAIGLYYLLSMFAANFLFGYTGGSMPPDFVTFLSPTVFIYQNFTYSYDSYMDADNATRIWTYELDGIWVIAVYALIGVALFVGGYFLYRLRHSESAGDVVAYRWLKPVFRYGVAVCMALTFGQLLYEIVWHIPFQNGDYYEIVPMGVCMTIAGIIGYYIASMLLSKSLRVFRRSWPGLLTVAAMVVIICCGVGLDVFGVVNRVPSANNIDQLYFNANYGDSMSLGVAHPLLDDAMALHQTIIDNEAAIRDAAADFEWDEGSDYTSIRFRYTMKDGSEVERRYQLYFTESEWNDPSTTAGQLNKLLNSPEALRDRYTIDEGYGLYYGYFNSYYDPTNHSFELESDQAQRLYTALLLDVEAGNILNAAPFGYDTKTASITASIGDLHLEGQMAIRNAAIDGVTYEYDSVYVEVTPRMTHTINALLAMDLLSEEALESFLIDYERDYNFDLNPNSGELTSFPEITSADVIAGLSSSASIGVIGGADGPTEIFVTGG